MRYGFVYEITNLDNDMKYIGKHKRSQDPNDPDDSSYLGSGKLIGRAEEKAMRELGDNWRSRFCREILCECDSEEELQEMERYYIRLYDAVNSDRYYNMVEDANPPVQHYNSGDAIRGKKQIHKGRESKFVSKEDLDSYLSQGWELGPPTHQRYSQSIRAKERLSDFNNHPMYGKRHSEETRRKISSNRGDYSGENHPMYGKRHSEESRIKMSESAKNRPPISEETRRRIAYASSHRSEETRKKLSESMKGRKNNLGKKYSEETRKRMSDSRKNKKYQKICTICGEKFISNSPSGKYCTKCRGGE